MFQNLHFRPFPGLASPHLQMFLASYCPPGAEAPSLPLTVHLNDGDQLSCQVSTPTAWQPYDGTIALLHGLGGSHSSPYMVRMSRKFYQRGKRVVRINLRGCGSGAGLNQKTYTSGDSQDITTVLELLKMQEPLSPIRLIGFSLGGNILLKMAGELGDKASRLIEGIGAVCPTLDLYQTVQKVSQGSNRLYQHYYLKQILKQGARWIGKQKIRSVQEFDEKITVPLWGYASTQDYYAQCSSLAFIPEIRVPCYLLFADDDPFIDYRMLSQVKLNSATKALLTMHGAHMGFIGSDDLKRGPFWLDQFLLDQALGF